MGPHPRMGSQLTDGDGEGSLHLRDRMVVVNLSTFHGPGVFVLDWGVDMLQHSVLKD